MCVFVFATDSNTEEVSLSVTPGLAAQTKNLMDLVI